MCAWWQQRDDAASAVPVERSSGGEELRLLLARVHRLVQHTATATPIQSNPLQLLPTLHPPHTTSHYLLRLSRSLHSLQTDAVIDLVRSGLSQTAVLSSRVGVFDREHKLTARAAKGLKSALQSATNNISSVQGRIDDLRSGAASAVESAKVTAGAAADRVRGTVTDVVDGASQKAASVKSSLDRSVTDLGQSVTGMAGSAMKSVRDTEAVEGAVRQLEALSSRVGAEVDRHPLLAGPRDAIVAATAEVKASLQVRRQQSAW